jgi:hypothetical protein
MLWNDQNVRCCYRSGQLKASVKEVAKCKFDEVSMAWNQQMINHYLKYNMIILVENLSENIRRENIFKLIIENETLYKTTDDNGIKNGKFYQI